MLTSLILLSLLTLPPAADRKGAPIAKAEELNRHAEAPDSHAGETGRSALEVDFRGISYLGEKELGYRYLDYPRLKILPDGSYFLLYQTRDQERGKNHDGVLSAFSRDGRTWERGPALWEKRPVRDPEGNPDIRYYATADAIVLQNGDLLAFAQYRLLNGSMKYRKSWGLAMKRSKDLGKTWSEETELFHDRCWEPFPLQLPNGEIQVYLTHTNHDWDRQLTDITLLRSFDNGETWTTLSPAMRFADGTSRADRKSVDMPPPQGESTAHFTSQMPAAVLLHDGKTILAAYESVRLEPSHKLMLSLGWNNASWPQGTLTGTREGPEKIMKNFVGGQAPYLAQFPSGETVLSYCGNFWYIRLADERGKGLAKAPFFSPVKLYARWGNLEIENAHLIWATAANVHKDPSEMYLVRDIVLAPMRLNHRIQAPSLSPEIDGDNADWAAVDESFFLGSDSQAQCCFRFAQDKKYLYVCVDCLDRELHAEDMLDLCFSDGKDASTLRKITLAADKDDTGERQGENVKVAMKHYPGEGYVAEFRIRRDALPIAGKRIFFNAILRKGTLKDTFNFRTLDKVDNWFEVKL
ncbi:MAG: exo-alpha-sialidase [Bacteroidales bacterium]|nr:exo-alpha-sialidase [Bacteroidales bacterium]